ncbi:putative cardiolipin synthase YwiE [Phaeobacter italicus]|jgi:cardiolipin synthase|uniref:Cardiolipin synthase n=1 Tax=Phaeobacter italicus TaxID=481446 RepID=A0A0H5DEF6_9RHOB|nr:cardiolipin synthase [Phaeobacter italicus]CRL09870.1 putative cardiolipin synthase YwiE [Phaeobacter italicus]
MVWLILSTAAVISMWVLAGLASLQAARTARTPQGAIGWVVFLLSAPLLALPLYLIFGHRKFSRYRNTRQKADKILNALRVYSDSHTQDRDALPLNEAPFERLAGYPICNGNRFDLLVDGPAITEAMLAAIREASDYVLVQFYIVRDDSHGRQLKDALIDARNRGVAVWFMTDAVGSHGLSTTFRRDLEKAGVNLVDPDTRPGPKHRFHLNFRNHRKTVIVDGQIGFTGGMNIGDEYMGRDPHYGRWRDTQVRLEGPVVQQLELGYCEDWFWLTEDPILDLLSWECPKVSSPGKPALVIGTGPGDPNQNGSMLYFSAISAARTRIWIASPYFVPDQDVVAALKNAAMRGVEVRILLPGIIDHYAPWLAAFSYFDDLRAAGVQIFRYTGGFLHQKVFVVDDCIAAVGTMNLDNRSFRLNFETMALCFDGETCDAVAAMLDTDFAEAALIKETLDEQTWQIRFGAPVARLLAPVL